ncbi:MAG: ATP-binding protein [Rhodobacteraceae bacterium]|nr:ATP-binding protein [Paracoccaceae bacterium]MBR9820206.1 ATP-binding protein [Paracoccaceae bacterium]
MKHQIGKVIEVKGDQIIASLLEFDGENNTGVPEEMNVDVSTPDGPESILIGQPGSFVELSLPNGSLLCLVTETRMREASIGASEVKAAAVDGDFLIEQVTRQLVTIPVGTLGADGSFERGTNILPTVNAPVFAVLPKTINQVYTSFAEGDFSLGRLSLLPEQEAKMNLDAFLGRHAAILGQTGGGKSWTVASVLQKISSFPQSTVLLLDLHGEYSGAFGEDAEVISATDIEMPYWLMNAEELLGLMIDRAESSAPNQNAKFKELLQAAKESHPENAALGLEKITIDTPVYFDLDQIIEDFRDLDTQTVAGSSGKPIKGPLHGQFTRLLMRLESRLNDRRYDLIFKPKTYNTSGSMDDLFRKILGEEISNRKKVIVLDLSPVPFDVRGALISLTLRCLFDFSYWYSRVNGERYPISIFADEAHIYLSDASADQAPRESAERIAKEGRKYGISLTVISQRPREMSSTILSQCGSFLCLRISNPDDQAYVRNLLPDSVRGITSMFSSLRRGEAILIGDSMIMPTRIKVDRPNPTPNSNDASFVKQWSEDPSDLDVAAVLHAWRNQKVVE